MGGGSACAVPCAAFALCALLCSSVSRFSACGGIPIPLHRFGGSTGVLWRSVGCAACIYAAVGFCAALWRRFMALVYSV